MTSPFKFLDSYTVDDRSSFFGRDTEVEDLYELVNKNRLVLVYGPSGSGKTSLIQCGLAGRFDATDWLSISIRRKDDINKDLFEAIRQKAHQISGAADAKDIIPLLERIHLYSLRPIYLIFDQFEELIISGSQKEQMEFFEIISEIYHSYDVPCFILLVMREEYLSNLFDFEEQIPTLFDRRMRVEKMASKTLKEVILKSCERFKIELEDEEENTKHIIRVISSGKSAFQLPYLQVYMDMLYQEDFIRTYPHWAFLEELPWPLPELEFTSKEIELFGEFDNVLSRYLNTQVEEISSLLFKQFPDESPKIIETVLDGLVTQQGTKRLIRFELEQIADSELGYRYKLLAPAPSVLQAIPLDVMTFLLKEMESRRLLRLLDEDVFELAHDSLADIIHAVRDDEQLRKNEAFETIRNAQRSFSRTEEYLSRKQLNFVEDYLKDLELGNDLKEYVELSYDFRIAQEQAEAVRLKKELLNQRKFNQAILLGFLLMAVLSAYAFFQTKEAKEEKNRAEKYLLEFQHSSLRFIRNDFQNSLQRGYGFMNRREFNNADTAFEKAHDRLLAFDSLAIVIKDSLLNKMEQVNIPEDEKTWNQSLRINGDSIFNVRESAKYKARMLENYNTLLSKAKIATSNQDYLKAMILYKQALNISIDNGINVDAINGIMETRLKLIPLYNDYDRFIKLAEDRGGTTGAKYVEKYRIERAKIRPHLNLNIFKNDSTNKSRK